MMEKKIDISKKILEGWHKKTKKFLEGNPICSECRKKLFHFSRTMLCRECKCEIYYEEFLIRNPGYRAQQYQKNRKDELIGCGEYYLKHKDGINLRRRIKYAAEHPNRRRKK